MTYDDQLNTIITTLQTFAAETGRECPNLTADTCPIFEIEDFSSLTGVEVTATIADTSGVEIPIPSLFGSDNKPNTIAQAAQELYERSLAGQNR